MEEFLKAVANFGFPIVVAVYLLFRMEKKMEQLSGEIGNLSKTIISLCEKIDSLRR